MSSNLHLVFRGSAVVLTGMMYGHVLAFLFRVILARHFETETFGTLGIGLSLIAIAVQISSLGLTQGIPAFIARMREEGNLVELRDAIRFGLLVVTLSGILSMILIIAASQHLATLFDTTTEFAFLIAALALIVPIQSFFNYLLAILRGLKDMTAMAVSEEVVNKTVLVGLALLLVLFNWSVYSVSLLVIIAFIPSILLAMAYLKKHYDREENSIREQDQVEQNSSVRKDLLLHSLPLMLAGISGILRHRLDVLLVGMFVSAQHAGLFYAAMPIMMMLTMMRNVFGRILLPVLSQVSVDKSNQIPFDEAYQIYESTARVLSLGIIPVSAFLMFFAEEIVVLLFGSAYAGAGLVLLFVTPGIFVYTLSGNFGALLQSRGHTKQVLYTSIWGTFANLTLIYLLINPLGIAGAAIAVGMSFAVMGMTGIYFVYRSFGFHPFSALLLRGTFLGLGSFSALYALNLWLFENHLTLQLLLFTVLAICYFLILMIAKLIKPEEVSIFLSIITSLYKLPKSRKEN